MSAALSGRLTQRPVLVGRGLSGMNIAIFQIVSIISVKLMVNIEGWNDLAKWGVVKYKGDKGDMGIGQEPKLVVDAFSSTLPTNLLALVSSRQIDRFGSKLPMFNLGNLFPET